jgi:hypothetical protein
MMVMYHMIYDVFMAKCNCMYMTLNATEDMYTVTARLHRMIYVVFHAKHINMPEFEWNRSYIYIYISL